MVFGCVACSVQAKVKASSAILIPPMTFQGSPLGGSGFYCAMILFTGLPGFVKTDPRTGGFLGTSNS
ncbi:UNVERIFIED_CONTAM: hypothetical protein ABIC26_002280 [Paenibacillus sp. PvR008]